MKNTFFLFLLASVVFLFGCTQELSENTANTQGNTNATAPAPAKDLKATLSELENKAYEAWKNKDGKYFESLLTQDFVEVNDAGRADRAATIKQISESPCEVNSFAISDENIIEIDEKTAVYYAKDDADFKCGDTPGPEKSYAATLFVKDGDTWKAAYHQSLVSSEAKNIASAASPAAGKKMAEEASADEQTKALSITENELWDAFMKNDFKPFEETMSLNFVNVTPEGYQNMAALKKSLADGDCKIKSFKLGDFKLTKISETVGLLTYKASQDGTCGDAAVPANVWASSIYVKDGDSWKNLFHMETAVPSADAKKKVPAEKAEGDA